MKDVRSLSFQKLWTIVESILVILYGESADEHKENTRLVLLNEILDLDDDDMVLNPDHQWHVSDLESIALVLHEAELVPTIVVPYLWRKL